MCMQKIAMIRLKDIENILPSPANLSFSIPACGTTGSLYPSFDPARLVGLTVKHPYAIALYARLPSVLRVPLKASVTLLEATTPVKLPTKHCLPIHRN